MGSGGRAVERRTVNRGDGGSISHTAVSKRRQFRSPHTPVSFGRDTKKLSHTGGKCVTCSASGLTNSREGTKIGISTKHLNMLYHHLNGAM